ncbi:MAG: AAA family ATPase, partial [Solirubrobacteraceae bacterium]
LADRTASATEALETGLLVSTGSRIGYRHALLRDAVYADLPEPWRTELHEQIATALSGSSAVRAAEVARHLRIAGRDAEAVRHLVDAAGDARRVGALDEAAEFLEEALQFAPQDGGLLLELGEVEAWRSRAGASRAAFDRAMASIPAGDGLARARAWIRRGRSFRGALCFPRESRTAYLEALTALGPADAEERAEALAGLAWTEAVAGDVEHVDPLLRELHGLVGREQPDSGLALDIGLARGHALIRLGRFAESYPPMIAAAEAGRRAGRPDLSYTCWINASSAAACAGQFDRSLEFADRCQAWMRDAGLRSLEANAMSARTHILIRVGSIAEALASADDARELAERLDNASLRAMATHDRGMVERELGNHASAERLLAEAIAGNAAVSRPLARLARAESLARLGRPEDAEEELRLTAMEPMGPSDFPDTLVARLTYVQALVADSRGDAGLARRRLEEAIQVWRRRTDRAGDGDDYMDVMVDLGRPPVAGLVEPQRELARLEAALGAMSERIA